MNTIDVVVKSFLRAKAAEGRSPETIRTYAQTLAVLDRHLGPNFLVTGLTRRVVSEYLASRSLAGNDFRVLRVFVNWLVSEEEMPNSPMARLRQPRTMAKPVPTFTDESIKRIISACEGRGWRERRDMAMLRLLIDTGIRRSELAGLTLNDVDLDQQVAVVTGKGKSRVVPFGSKSSVALDRWLRSRRETPTLFGLTPSGCYQALRDRAASAGVSGWHTHRHRHDVAHRWLAAGGSEGDLMALAGWSSRSLLDRYGASARTQRAIAAHRRIGLGDRH